MEVKIKIIYYIVGDGPMKEYVLKQVQENSFFKIIFVGSLPHHELDNFLLDKVDVLTAMGTSALEGAKLAIPTILLDISYKKIKDDYLFRFLYQTHNYDLGHLISKSDFKKGNDNLKNIVLSIANNYELESKATYDYFINNHSLGEVLAKFIDLSTCSKLNFGMINQRHLKKPVFLKYYNKLRKLET